MNREQQQASEIDEIRSALERKPETVRQNPVWLNHKVDKPQLRLLPYLISTLAVVAAAAAYAFWPTSYSKQSEPEPQQFIPVALDPVPSPVTPTQPTKPRIIYVQGPASAAQVTKPTPSPKPSLQPQPQPRPAVIFAPSPEVNQQLKIRRHEAEARNEVLRNGCFVIKIDSTEPVPGWDGRYRTKGSGNYIKYGRDAKPRRFEVLTQETDSEIKAVDFDVMW